MSSDAQFMGAGVLAATGFYSADRLADTGSIQVIYVAISFVVLVVALALLSRRKIKHDRKDR